MKMGENSGRDSSTQVKLEEQNIHDEIGGSK
jgi:hypothetical protein